jgi:hypothetical protein
MRQADHVADIGKKRNVYSFQSAKLKEKDHLEDLGIDERIILNGA